MNKNLTSHQLLLFALAGVLLLIAAFSLYLLRDPSAPLPFAPPPATSTPTLPPPSATPLPTLTKTPVPTRQTSYTPFAITPATGVPTTVTPLSSPPGPTASQGSTTATPNLTNTTQATTPTSTRTINPTYSGPTLTPTLTATLSQGEVGVTGRITRNGTPVPNIIVSFQDDVASRQAITNQGGHYWFTTLAPGTSYTLTFRQSDNQQLVSSIEVASVAWIKGNLPTNVNPIDLPDFEISVNLNGMLYELQSPFDGSTYSASVISLANPIQFVWSLYSLGGAYRIELGPRGSDQPIWTSGQLASTYIMWDGTLDDGTHITEGAYWWRVSVTKSLGNYVQVIYAQPWDILFNP
jgi:Carboxypeptidase regulatory-like domain